MLLLRTHHAVKSQTGTFIVLRSLADSSDFGLLGSKVPQKVLSPALDADELPCKI